jgi:hypothetical protein
MRIKTEDKIVQKVLAKMDERSLIGQKKYGATMMDEIEGQKKDLNRFLIDVQEELMDALLYIEAAKRCLTDEVEECMLNRMNIIGQNGNDGLHYEDEEEL